MIKIKDVALKSGFSTSTVSRVLNGNGYVSEDTKQKVMRVVKEVGYTPNAIAQGLKQGMTNTIALMIPSTDNVMFPEIARGVEDVARQNGLIVILCNTNDDISIEKEYILKLKKRFIDGIIICSMKPDADHIRKLHLEEFPLVLAVRHYNDGIDTVAVDNYTIGYQATTHLINTGCRRIAMLLGQQKINVYRHRYEGYRHALFDHGIEIDEEIILSADESSDENWYELTLDLLRKEKGIDAIFASSDPKAIYAMRAVLDYGLRIPEDISVMGVDNLQISNFIEPPLTTISQPLYNIGVVAANKLLQQIECKKSGRNYIPSLEILNTELIERNSTRK